MHHFVVHRWGKDLNLASYARTSEDARQRDGHGVRYQLRINERTAYEYGCRVVATYTDNGRSASKEGVLRHGFERLVEDLTLGRTPDGHSLDGVVCVADDRLYRRPDDLARFFTALTSRPGRVYLDPTGCRDPYTQEGLMQALRSLEVAATETQVRSRRLRDWHWARAAEGVPHSGPRPFGWLEDRLTRHPREAALVEQAISDRIAGKPVRAIARDWCDLGITGTRGGRPNAQSVTQIITAPRVCGYRSNRGKLLLVPGTDRPVLGNWEPIVAPGSWEAVCGTFSPGSLFLHRGSGAPRRTDERRAPARHLATGFLRCGAQSSDGRRCQGAMCAQKGRSGRSPYVYTCRSCGRCSISGPLADEALGRLLLAGPPAGPALSEEARRRWESGGLAERRQMLEPVLLHCVVRPGVKGWPTWDFSRITAVWR